MSGTSFTAGRDNKGAFATGMGATAITTITETVAPDLNIKILDVLATLHQILARMPGVERKALARLEEAQEEAAKPEPKREEVKALVTQAAHYAKDVADFGDAMEKLKPHLIHVAAWAGSTWQTWAPTLGLG